MKKKRKTLGEEYPELAKQWHPTKNGSLKPTSVHPGSQRKVWWLYAYDDPKTGKHFDFEWQASIANRVKTPGCPFLSGRAVWPGYNDLATRAPELAKEWHPTKNGSLKPTDVTPYSNKKVWWLYPYDDPETGKHFDFEWRSDVRDRSRRKSCPYLSGRAVWPGYNDLATRAPELAKEWHPMKNGDLKPTDVTLYSNKKVWWLYSYVDPETGKHFDFEWEARIRGRSHGRGCPYLVGNAVWPGFNDLATKAPELAKEWHPMKNGDLKPTGVSCGMQKLVWWYLPYDDPETGEHFNFEWKGRISDRVHGIGCPYLSGQAVWPGFNDLASNCPELVREWHPIKNRRIIPQKVYKYDKTKRWWLCERCGNSWRTSVFERAYKGTQCPKCSKRA